MYCPIALFAEFQNKVTDRHWIACHDEESPRKAGESACVLRAHQMYCPIALFADFQNKVTNRHWIASHDGVSPRKALEYVHTKCSVQ